MILPRNPLAWLRLALAAAYFVVMSFLNLAAFVLSLFNSAVVGRLLRIEAIGLLAILGVTTRLDRDLFTRQRRRAHYLFLANHQSMLDILIVFAKVPEPVAFIAKKELFWIPFLNIHLWCAGCLSMDRQVLKRSYRDIRRAIDALRRKRSLFIFPEGTRQTSDAIGPFKPGFLHLAQESGAEIVPVVIRGAGRALPRGSLRINPQEPVTVSLGAPLAVSSLDPAGPVKDLRSRFMAIYEGLKKNSGRRNP